MADHIELEIRNMLNSQYSAREITGRLLNRMFETKLSDRDRQLIYGFVVNSGCFQEAVQILPQMFSERLKIPWAYFMEILNRHRIYPSPEIIECCFKGAKRLDQLFDLVYLSYWDGNDQRFAQIRGQIADDRLQRHRRQRELLFEKLTFYKNSQLIDEEHRMLNLLLKMYPDDERLLNWKEEFEERWAKHVIAKRSGSETEHLEPTFPQFNRDELDWAWFLTKEIQKLIGEKDQAAYDLAIGMWFMEFYDCALILVDKIKPTTGSDWLKTELLIRVRRYLDALEWLVSLEKKYANDPETPFAITYWRAQALWGMGQTSSAIELMKSLLQVRPDYRSAGSLLNEWLAGGAA